MDAYQQPPPYMRPPSGPPPPADPYSQYYQHPARPPVPPPPSQSGGPAWYPNQFHNPHSPSPPPQPPQQWRSPSPHFPQGEPYSSSAYPPFPAQSHQQPFNAGANGSSQFPPPAGPMLTPPYPHANQEWGNPNWGHHQGHTSQANSNVEDWGVKAKEWAAANKDQHSQSAPKPPSGQVYTQYPTHGYQDVHQQAVPGLSYQQFPVPATMQPDRYPNYATGNENFPGGLSHQENLPTSSAINQQEVPYSYSSVAGTEESNNMTQHEVQISVPDGGGPVRTEQQMQYAYGYPTSAPPSSLNDQPLQFATRESSDYATLHNAWPSHAATGVVYPPIPSSLQSIPQHDPSMAMPPVSSHTMPPFAPPNVQPGGPPYGFGTKPPLHPVAAFVDESYAASSVPPKKAPVPNWLKEDILKTKVALGRRSSGSFEERESMDDDVHFTPSTIVDQHDRKSLSPSKSSDEDEEDEDDEMDAARTAAINLEIKRILTEVLLKVTDELFDEIATKVINEDETLRKDDSVQHNHKSSSSFIAAADPTHKASAKILVSLGDANKKAGTGSPADVLGLGSYASDDDDADTDAASNADADGSDGVESLGMGSRNAVNQQPGSEKLPEPKAMVSARLDPKVEVGDMSPKNNKSGLDQMLGSRINDDEADTNKNVEINASSGLLDDTSGSRTNNPDRTNSDKDAMLEEPQRKNSGLESDCKDSNTSYGEDSSVSLSKDRSRTDDPKTGKEKVSQDGSKEKMKQNDIKSAEKVKGFESNKKSTDLHVKKDSRDAERSHKTNSKEDRVKKKEKEKEEERPRHRHAEDSSKEKRRRSPSSNGSSDDSIRKSQSRRRNRSPSPVRSRRKRSSPTSDESSDDSRRKSSSRRRNRSPSPERSRRRHVSSRSPHSKHSEHKHSLSSHDKSRSRRSRSRSPHRRKRG